MLYLSQLINKTVYQDGKSFGKIIDMAVFENRPKPPISKIEIQHGREKLTIAPQALLVESGHLVLKAQHIPLLPYVHKDFYLVEDLLDKQVIDTDGRRLVRVNDVVLENNGELKVTGIDIGFAGVLRRLGIGDMGLSTTVLPWSVIEAFDYQTGDVRIKLKQSSLNTLHPAEIADILEEAGAKERVGIVEALDTRNAARALEEADEETQVSILENIEPNKISEIVNKMHITEIADFINQLNPLRMKEVVTALGEEKAKKLKRLSLFSDNVAGGLMHVNFFEAKSTATVKAVLAALSERGRVPETIVIVNDEKKFVGVIQTKDLIVADKLALLDDIVTERKYVSEKAPLADIVELFAQYNLRVVPVVDKEKNVTGIILIDDLLKIIEEEQHKDENI